MPESFKSKLHFFLPAGFLVLLVPDFIYGLLYLFLGWENPILDFLRRFFTLTFEFKVIWVAFFIPWAIYMVVSEGGFYSIVDRYGQRWIRFSLLAYGFAVLMFFFSFYLESKIAAFQNLPPNSYFKNAEN